MAQTSNSLSIIPCKCYDATDTFRAIAKTHVADVCACLPLPNLGRLVTQEQSFGMLLCGQVHKHIPRSPLPWFSMRHISCC